MSERRAKGRRNLGRPPTLKLSKELSRSVRQHVRKLLDEHGVSRASFDEMLERGERFTDNALNQGDQIPADKALLMLEALAARYRDALAFSLADSIRRSAKGMQAPLPMLLPERTVSSLVDAFERYAISQTKATFADAAAWSIRLRDFLEKIRFSSDLALRQELEWTVRRSSSVVKEHGIDADSFAAALTLASHLSRSGPSSEDDMIRALER